MRNLTIQRQKSFVASLAAFKVYIEDPVAGDLNINGCMCRKLGKIKNNETVTFQIDNTAARVYVIADKLSRGYCNEFYPLPAGTEDVVLSGKCRYNPAAGNPFRFDGVADESVIKNRKRNVRIGIIILVIAFLAGVAIGVMNNLTRPKTFQFDGFAITLTDEFEDYRAAGYDEALISEDVCFLVLEEPFTSLLSSSTTLEEYAALVQQANGHSYELKTENGILYYEYTAPGDDGEYFHYFITLHKGTDAFWVMQFFTYADEADNHRNDIFEWVSTITFSE